MQHRDRQEVRGMRRVRLVSAPFKGYHQPVQIQVLYKIKVDVNRRRIESAGRLQVGKRNGIECLYIFGCVPILPPAT